MVVESESESESVVCMFQMGFGASKMDKGSTKEENVNSSAGVNPSGSEQGSEKQV